MKRFADGGHPSMRKLGGRTRYFCTSDVCLLSTRSLGNEPKVVLHGSGVFELTRNADACHPPSRENWERNRSFSLFTCSYFGQLGTKTWLFADPPRPPISWHEKKAHDSDSSIELRISSLPRVVVLGCRCIMSSVSRVRDPGYQRYRVCMQRHAFLYA